MVEEAIFCIVSACAQIYFTNVGRRYVLNIHEKVVAFLDRYMDVENVKEDMDFVKAGLVNSLFAMQLVIYLESEFSIVVENEDIDPQNFSTIGAIVRFVERKTMAAV